MCTTATSETGCAIAVRVRSKGQVKRRPPPAVIRVAQLEHVHQAESQIYVRCGARPCVGLSAFFMFRVRLQNHRDLRPLHLLLVALSDITKSFQLSQTLSSDDT
jgi:hypothetical protein